MLIPRVEIVGGISTIHRSGTILSRKMNLLVSPCCFRILVSLLGSVQVCGFNYQIEYLVEFILMSPNLA